MDDKEIINEAKKRISKNLNEYERFIKERLESSKDKKEKLYYQKLLMYAKSLKKEFALRERLKRSILIPKRFDYPIGVQLELTYKCNQRCLQCYNNSGTTKDREITGDEWVGIVENLVKFPIRDVVISGGEPTLLGDTLIKIMDIFHKNGAYFRFITNGMLIDEEWINKLAKYDFSFIQFSIDGATPEVHDKIRGAKGSYDRVIKAALLAKSYGLPVAVASVIMKLNLHQLEDLIDQAYMLGAFRIIIGAFMYAGRAIKNKGQLELNEQELFEIEERIEKKRGEYGNRMLVVKALDPAASLRYHVIGSTDFILIRPNGDVRIDCQAPFKIGNILEESVEEIWKRVGWYAWQHNSVLNYVDKVKHEFDILNVEPRTHYDEDLLLEPVL